MKNEEFLYTFIVKLDTENRIKNMNLNEYQKLAQISARKDRSKKDVLINSAMGLCGESGEAIDYIKKHLFHDHPLEKEVLMKEMGDVLWYLADMAEALDVMAR